jgi:hypothetical protein
MIFPDYFPYKFFKDLINLFYLDPKIYPTEVSSFPTNFGGLEL